MRQAVEVHQDRQREGEMRKRKRRIDGTATLSAAISDTYLNTYLPLQHGTASKYAEPALSTRVRVNETCSTNSSNNKNFSSRLRFLSPARGGARQHLKELLNPTRGRNKALSASAVQECWKRLSTGRKKVFLMKSSIYQIQYILGIYSVTDETGTNCTIGSRTGVISGTPHTVMELRSKR